MENLITTLGNTTVRSGSYLLHVRVKTAVSVSFGRFSSGEPVPVPAGMVVYIGSAMGQKGSGSLARRLLRHATRTRERPFHPIRRAMLTVFPSIGLADLPLHPPPTKTCHWHIDYLLDHEAVDLTHVMILRSRQRLEGDIARLLTADPATFVIRTGLGAGDAAGETHLLGVTAVSHWWQTLPDRLAPLLE